MGRKISQFREFLQSQISGSPTDAAELAQVSGMPVHRVQVVLTRLKREGRVIEIPAGQARAAGRGAIRLVRQRHSADEPLPVAAVRKAAPRCGPKRSQSIGAELAAVLRTWGAVSAATPG